MLKLLVTDLDNTLYDWVGYYATAFSAMARELAVLVGVPLDQLLDEFRAVHRRYRNTEQPFAALELPSVLRAFGSAPRCEMAAHLQGPFQAFNAMRDRHLVLFSGVAETLRTLHGAGVTIVGHTEAKAVNATYRLRKLGIERYFDRLYAFAGTTDAHPDPRRWGDLGARDGLLRRVPPEERKPNPTLLLDICAREGVRPADAFYVGDSLVRDVTMAKAAGVRAIWARYGSEVDPAHWDVLVRITHWSEGDVAREAGQRQRADQIAPDHIIDSYGELVPLVLGRVQRQAVASR